MALAWMVQVDSDEEEEALCIDSSCIESPPDEQDNEVGSGNRVQWGGKMKFVSYAQTPCQYIALTSSEYTRKSPDHIDSCRPFGLFRGLFQKPWQLHSG